MPITVYKLTDQDGQTYGNTQWGPGVTHEALGPGNVLCTSGLIHYYHHPLLAVLLNPIGANFPNPLLWEAEIEQEAVNDHGLKGGAKKLTTRHQVALPVVTSAQRVGFAILCAKEVYHEPDWNSWTDNWLSGKDRSAKSAKSAWSAALSAWSAESAESAAKSAAWSAESAESADLNLIAHAEQAVREKE